MFSIRTLEDFIGYGVGGVSGREKIREEGKRGRGGEWRVRKGRAEEKQKERGH